MNLSLQTGCSLHAGGRIRRLLVGVVVYSVLIVGHGLLVEASEAPSAQELLQATTRDALDAAGLPPGSDAFRTALLESAEWQHELFDSGPVSDRS